MDHEFRLLSVEGPGCVGKTTVARTVSAIFAEHHIQAVLVPEFSSSPLGKALDNATFVGDDSPPLWRTGLAGLLAFLADKVAAFESVYPATVMIADRTVLSQCAVGIPNVGPQFRGAAMSIIAAVEEWLHHVAPRQLTLFLTCEFDVLRDRYVQRAGRSLNSLQRARMQYECDVYESLRISLPPDKTLTIDTSRTVPGVLDSDIASRLIEWAKNA